MDLLDHLDGLKTRKTAYKKGIEHFYEEQGTPIVAGDGFLFGSSILNKVKSRLEGSGDLHETTKNRQDIMDSQTQALSFSYDGDDLENSFEKPHFDTQQPAKLESKGGHTHQVTSPTNPDVSPVDSDCQELMKESFQGNDQSRSQAGIYETQRITEDFDGSPSLESGPLNSKNNSMQLDLVQTLADVKGTGTEETQVKMSSSRLEFTSIDRVKAVTIQNSEIKQLLKEDDKISYRSCSESDTKLISNKNFTKEEFVKFFDGCTDCSSDSESDSDFDEHKKTIEKPKSTVDNVGALEGKVTDNFELNQDQEEEGKPKSLGIYQIRLRNEMAAQANIELGSDSDEDYLVKSQSLSNKAAVLELRARLSKKHKKNTIRKPTSGSHTTNLRDLFHDLKKANKTQILEKRREKFSQKGISLEEIDREKESVENLLEQEIARNKKIRLKEKRQELTNKGEVENDFQDELGYSSNELVSDDSVNENSILGDLPQDRESTETDYEQTNDDFDEEKDEDDVPILARTGRAPKITHFSDSDEKDSNRTTERNVIDLGMYGDNIHITNEKLEQAKVPKSLHYQSLKGDLHLTQENAKVNDVSSSAEQPKNLENLQYREGNDETINSNDQEELIYVQKIQQLIERKSRQEAKLKKKRVEMRNKGIHDMVEVEAEESEDEWFGIGGADGEISEEYDSELEDMIDDYSKQDVNPDEIRQKLIQEEKIYDETLINKILHDIKNGGFRKRGRGALDIEISDDEDDELKKYHVKRRELLKRKLLENGDVNSLVKNPKSQPFFESMIEDFLDFQKPSESDHNSAENEMTKQKQDSKDDQKDTKDGKIVVSQDFVHKTLSFLTSKEDVDEHFGSSGFFGQVSQIHEEPTEATDLLALKQNSSIKNLKAPERTLNINSDTMAENESRAGNLQTPFKSTFGSKNDENEKFKEGMKTVRALNSYKTAGSSKSAITYLGKSRKLIAPKRRPKSKVSRSQSTSEKRSIVFRNDEKSFEN